MYDSNAELNNRLARLEYIVEQLSQRIDAVEARLQKQIIYRATQEVT